ncbi:hypothetical protein KUTeg_004265 [Tegillarca granosa]|uniref:CARD domain-containing protein n=1 Tax=Tegillarca granosa TaxID=220873 RepID=A0ABQ9FPG4_TEGGR|nr:hypothetical protein KUTeg_004265 [Tegillarca granosa]
MKSDEEESDLYDELIERNRLHIVKVISPTWFYDPLRTQSVLTATDCEEVEGNRTRWQKAGSLLDILRTKGNNGVQKFLEILEFEHPECFKKITKKEPREPPPGYCSDAHKRESQFLTMIDRLPQIARDLTRDYQEKKDLTNELKKMTDLLQLAHTEKQDMERENESLRCSMNELKHKVSSLEKNLALSLRQVEKLKDESNELARSKRESASLQTRAMGEREVTQDTKTVPQTQAESDNLRQQGMITREQILREERDEIREKCEELSLDLDKYRQESEEYHRKYTQCSNSDLPETDHRHSTITSSDSDGDHELPYFLTWGTTLWTEFEVSQSTLGQKSFTLPKTLERDSQNNCPAPPPRNRQKSHQWHHTPDLEPTKIRIPRKGNLVRSPTTDPQVGWSFKDPQSRINDVDDPFRDRVDTSLLPLKTQNCDDTTDRSETFVKKETLLLATSSANYDLVRKARKFQKEKNSPYVKVLPTRATSRMPVLLFGKDEVVEAVKGLLVHESEEFISHNPDILTVNCAVIKNKQSLLQQLIPTISSLQERIVWLSEKDLERTALDTYSFMLKSEKHAEFSSSCTSEKGTYISVES